MPFITTPIPDLLIFEPVIHGDERGYFYESYTEQTFAAAGINSHFLQDNQAKSVRGVLRGLHYQVPPFAQAKLVRVVQGEVLDIAVDIRPKSATFGQWFGVGLSDENHRQLYVPRGFAHGYVVLSETAIFTYKCDNVYSKAHEGGVLYNDPAIGIDWEYDLEKLLLSEKDKAQPLLAHALPF